jgi:hypothetical protein
MSQSIIKPLTLAEYQALVTGIPTYCPTATLLIAGQTFTAPQAVTYISAVLAAVSATATAKTDWKGARIAEEAIVAQCGATVQTVREVIGAMFSNTPTTLAALAITPKKPRTPLSAEARAAANAKAKATRAARGTMSKAKKALIVGNVTGVSITPITSSQSSSTPIAATATASALPVTASSVSTPAIPAVASAPAATPSNAPHS